MSNKMGTLTGLLVLLAGGAGIYVLSRQGPAASEEPEQAVETVVPVRVAQVRRATLRDCLQAYGSVIPNPGIGDVPPASVRINSPLDAMVIEVHCIVGQDVRYGQVLFALYDRLAKLAVEQAEKGLTFAQENFERQGKLRQVEGTSAKLYLEAQQQLDNARSQLSRAQAELELFKVTAPFDGTIMDVCARVGETVARTDPLVQLTDLRRLVVKVGVPSRQAGKVEVGQPVVIESGTSEASTDQQAQTLAGRLDYVDRQVDSDNDTVVVLVGLPASAGLRPGAFVRVRIIVAEYPDRLVVPRESVVTTREGQTVVAVVQGDEAIPTPVKCGVREDDLIEVEGPGLAPGVSVVTVGAYGLPGRTKIRMMGQ